MKNMILPGWLTFFFCETFYHMQNSSHVEDLAMEIFWGCDSATPLFDDVYTASLQDKHIEEVRKNKESKDPADETEAD